MDESTIRRGHHNVHAFFLVMTTYILIFTFLFLLPGLQHSPAQFSKAPASIMSGTRLDVDINGIVYLLDSKKNTVRRFSKDRVLLTEIGGSGWGDNRFDQPMGIWARNGIDVFVADYGNHRIQRFDRNLSFVSSLYTRDRTNTDERFGYPTDVTLSRLGDLYICDGENSRIVKLSGFSKVERSFGGFDAGRGRLHNPTRIEMGPQDHVYVVDGNRVVVFDSFGNFIRQIGNDLFTGELVIFADAFGLVVLNDERLFVFDENDALRTTIPVASLVDASDSHVRSMAVQRRTLYLMTEDGLITAPDPR
ncbi:MAG: NHL repeat-containing protein [Ignavibacteriae bacterium]|nr:NHL repeat-containing protein [Ignavibacteriota bacterium]